MKIAVVAVDDDRVGYVRSLKRTIDLLTETEEDEVANIAALRILRGKVDEMLKSFCFVEYEDGEGRTLLATYREKVIKEVEK